MKPLRYSLYCTDIKRIMQLCIMITYILFIYMSYIPLLYLGMEVKYYCHIVAKVMQSVHPSVCNTEVPWLYMLGYTTSKLL